ncbi:MAG TPA: OsmC family protein [Thermoanaerobaculia bacterium]|nr:OsmC family protein [Thermoanaerobaculia bacterium]
MSNTEHHYATTLTWEGNRGDGTRTYAGYGREHTAVIENKPELALSADPTFRGDATRLNPEDLLLVAAASCHMLSYLAICAKRGINVLSYRDRATGTLQLDARGGGRFSEIVLHPEVVIDDADEIARALALHEEAHQLCFIANSVSAPIRHEASVHASTVPA